MKNLNRIQGVVLGTVASWPDGGSVAMIGKQEFGRILRLFWDRVFCCNFHFCSKLFSVASLLHPLSLDNWLIPFFTDLPSARGGTRL